MRVAHLLPDTDDAGAENQARYLLGGLRDRGVEAQLVFFGRGKGHDRFAELGLPMHEVPRRRRLALDAWRRAREVRRLFAEEPPDVLHTWLLEGNIVGLLAARAWAPRSKVVITARAGAFELNYRGLMRVQRALLPRADRAISNSAEGGAMLEALGMRPEHVAVIANGVPEERVAVADDRSALRAELGLDPDQPVVATIARADTGNVVREKGFEVLLSAMAAVWRERGDAVLLLVGPTPAQLAALGIELPANARALGWLPQPARALHAADVFVLPSISEGHSNAASEALMVGLPVASTRTGAHVPIVEEAGGRVVDVGDFEALGAAVLDLLASPPEREHVRQVARRRMSVDAMVQSTLDLYAAAVNGS